MERTGPFRTLSRAAVLLLAVSAAGAHPASGQSISAGANVNVAGGPASITQGPPFRIEGDPYLQRQNEPSMACSSRNALNCLAAANDYRLVDVPGLPDGHVTADAWLGVYWSRDAGATWRSTMLPGFLQDTSPEGIASPLKGLEAGADPTVRAGTNGLFYLSGIAFNRSAEATDGPQGRSGVLFVSTFIDDNNTERADSPMRYIRTVVVDKGTSGQFLDKPWIATDVPRAGAGTCTIPGSGGVPDQTVPAGPVYVAWANFPGSGNNPHTKLMFARSTDCGVTWSQPTKLDESFSISQSPIISVNPAMGGILVAWRQFGTRNLSDPGRILVATSTDLGRTFTAGREVASLGAITASVAFDQPTLPAPGEPAYRMFRTNGYPAACTDSTGVHRIAWAQRGVGPGGDARIVVTSSTDGVTWSTPQPVDNHGQRGHQFMPSMACTGTRATVAWLDQRYDNAAIVFGPGLFGPFILDPIPPPPAHTLDVRAARSDATGVFQPSSSVQVSRYQYAFDPESGSLVQLEFNPVNWPLFAGGTVPFIGDYIDLVPARVFLPPVGGGAWSYDTDSTAAPVLHAVWADNRDVVPALSDDWQNWAAPGTAACGPGTQSTTRNQNVYTSRLSAGLIVGASGNSRPVGAIQRAFAVFARNQTATTRRFRFVAGVPPGGTGSFRPDGPLAQLEAEIPPFSTVARTVFVPAPASGAVVPVVVSVTEIDPGGAPIPGGLTGTAIVNSDPAAPPPDDGTVVTAEIHTPSISDAFVETYDNPTFLNPTFLNPTFLNPTFLNPTFLNPTFLNPTFLNPTFLNPTFLNPTFLNPTFLNPTFLNPTFINQPLTTDVSWQVTNEGNVASGYNFSAVLSSLPADAAFQLIINRIYTTPGANGCVLGEQFNAEVLTSITSPTFINPTFLNSTLSADASNATFVLNAGDMAVVTLRVTHGEGGFDPGEVGAVVMAHAPNTGATSPPSAVYDASPPELTLPEDIVVEAGAASGNAVTYSASATDALDGDVTISCTPESGSIFPIGATTVSCSAADSRGNEATGTFTVTVRDAAAPVIGPVSNITVNSTSTAGAVVTYASPATSDLVDGSGVATCSPASGSTFPVGVTTVTCTATDSAGNAATPVTFTVTVMDMTAPAIVVTANPSVLLWSPNKTMVPVTVSGNVSDSSTISKVSFVVSDEYGQIQPSGTATVTGGAFSFVVSLQAWRQGSDANGRLYTVTVTAVDAAGNMGTGSTFVRVPHDQK